MLIFVGVWMQSSGYVCVFPTYFSVILIKKKLKPCRSTVGVRRFCELHIPHPLSVCEMCHHHFLLLFSFTLHLYACLILDLYHLKETWPGLFLQVNYLMKVCGMVLKNTLKWLNGHISVSHGLGLCFVEMFCDKNPPELWHCIHERNYYYYDVIMFHLGFPRLHTIVPIVFNREEC